MAATDPAAAWAAWAAEREALYRDHPSSPVPAVGAGDVPGAALAVRRPVAVRGRRRAPAPGVRTGRPRRPGAPEQRRRRRSPSIASGASACRCPTARRRCRCSGCAATRAACSCRSAMRRAATRRTAPAATSSTRQGRGPRQRPGRRHDRRGPQLLVPALVRLRPQVGVPARAAREPAGRPDRGRRAAPLIADRRCRPSIRLSSRQAPQPERHGAQGDDERPAGDDAQRVGDRPEQQRHRQDRDARRQGEPRAGGERPVARPVEGASPARGDRATRSRARRRTGRPRWRRASSPARRSTPPAAASASAAPRPSAATGRCR